MEINKNLLWLETGEKGEKGMALTVRFTGRIGESAGMGLLLTGPDGYRLEQKLFLTEEKEAVFFCPGVNLWDPEHPFLYHAAVTLECGEKILAVREENIGFRTLEKAGQELLWNHTPLKLRGICYRERKEDREGTKKDLELFAAAHINFLRSIYGPFSGYLLQLCDEMGFLAEDTAPFYEVGQEKPALQDLPHCREEFLKPVKRLLEDGCHVSVLIWSLGHDCAWGANFRAAAEWIRVQDPLRPLTFHLPMSIPEEEEQMDIWPVHYIDWRQPFDVCFDQMVIFHTPGAENEIGYMTAQADYEVPVLHEVWSPVACHNRDEILHDPAVRRFWGESISRFWEKAYRTSGCLGGAVLAGTDEDGRFEGMGKYEWGILDREHKPKPEYRELRKAYAPAAVLSSRLEGEELTLEVENRFLFTDLSVCRLFVNNREVRDMLVQGKNGSERRTDGLTGEPGGRQKVTVRLPGAGKQTAAGERMEIRFESRDNGRCYGEYSLIRRGERKAEEGSGPENKGKAEAFSIRQQEEDTLLIGNRIFTFLFSRKDCLLREASIKGRRVLAGGPMLNCTGFLPGDWKGKTIDAKQDGEKVLVTITGSYEGTIDVRFLLTLSPDGTIDTSYEVLRLYRHMPHKVKAQIGISPGGLLEKGGSWLLAEGLETFCCTDAEGAKARMSLAADAPWQSWHHICEAVITDQKGLGVAVYSDGSDSVRLQKDPMLSPEAVVNDRDGRMHFTGDWHRMEDACGNYRGTETLSRKKGDCMHLSFMGTGIRLYGPLDINYGMCRICLDGQEAEIAGQYPDKVDFPGMSRGYEKRYGVLLFEAHGLPEGEHSLTVTVLGEAQEGAQNTYTSIDYAVVEGIRYPEGIRLHVNQDYNYPRLVRGCYMRPAAELVPGRKETFRIRLLSGGEKGEWK